MQLVDDAVQQAMASSKLYTTHSILIVSSTDTMNAKVISGRQRRQAERGQRSGRVHGLPNRQSTRQAESGKSSSQTTSRHSLFQATNQTTTAGCSKRAEISISPRSPPRQDGEIIARRLKLAAHKPPTASLAARPTTRTRFSRVDVLPERRIRTRTRIHVRRTDERRAKEKRAETF